MTQEALEYITNLLKKEAKINYKFLEWKGKITYPYFVGEYQESEALNENGMQDVLFILNGFTRNEWLELEQAKATIEKVVNKRGILPNGNGIAIMYSNSLVVPTGENELKRMEIRLKIKEWRI